MIDTPSTPKLTEPLVFLSSEGLGWQGLLVEAFDEPMELDGWVDPVIPDVKLMLLTRGTMLIEQRRWDGSWKALPFRQGDFSLRPAGVVTSELRWRALSPEPMQTLHIQLDHHLLARTAEELSGRDASRLALVGRAGFQDALLAQIGFALWRELEQPTPAGKLYAQTAAHLLAVHLLHHYAAEKIMLKPPPALTTQQVQHITDFVQAHLATELSLEQLAQQVGFSPYHFARLFRQATGHSPHQFVLQQRIARARHLLRQTELPLHQIALDSGFATQSHFTQVFRRATGFTPKAYRQQA